MPLEVLASIVAVGLAAVWIMMRLMGGFDRELRFTDDAVAHAEWAADNPTAPPPLAITVAASGKAALVRNRRGLGGLIWVMGLDSASHDLAGATTRPHRRGGLRVILNDFAAPSVVVELTPPDEIPPTWQNMIEEAT